MFGLPEGIDFTFLVNAALIQVCIGENEVVLNFDSGVSIMCASTIRYTQAGREARSFDDPRDAGKILVELLSAVIDGASGSTDGTLQLLWSTGAQVDLLDSWKEYESYTVKHGETLIVV
jgi:hypothetical protein